MKDRDLASLAVLMWCRTYTAVAPAEARERRREEITSFLFDLRGAGVASRRVVRGALMGVIDDLRWCSAERAFADLPPISITIPGALTLAASLTFANYLVTMVVHPFSISIVFAAAVVLGIAYGRAAFLWRRRRRNPLSAYSLTELSSHYTVRGMERVFAHPLRIYRVLVPLLVVGFLVSGVGSGTPSTGGWGYRIGATAWAIAWLTGLVIVLFTLGTLLYRAARRSA